MDDSNNQKQQFRIARGTHSLGADALSAVARLPAPSSGGKGRIRTDSRPVRFPRDCDFFDLFAGHTFAEPRGAAFLEERRGFRSACQDSRAFVARSTSPEHIWIFGPTTALLSALNLDLSCFPESFEETESDDPLDSLLCLLVRPRLFLPHLGHFLQWASFTFQTLFAPMFSDIPFVAGE